MTRDAATLRAESEAAVLKLVAWAHTARNIVPEAALRRAARVIGDDLAAIIAARNEPEVAAFQANILERGHPPEATVYRGGQPRTDRLGAAVANATAGCWLELDEGYRLTPCHAGLYILPALMAEAEASGSSVDDVLRALVVAYEMVTRVALSWTVREMVMHSHARYAAIGAAAGVALLRRVDQTQLLAAFTAAATLITAGPRVHAVQGALVRNAWAGAGAANGMMSVEWARCGMGGVPSSFYDVYTVLLGSEAHPEVMAAGLGEEWAIFDGYTKTHACCQHTHSAVEAVLDLRSGLQVSDWNDAVESIVVEAHPLAKPLCNYDPPTTLAAKFSLPHVVAAALIEGDAGVPSFSVASLTAADVSALRRKVKVVSYEPLPAAPDDRPARVTVRLKNGKEYSTTCLSAVGGPDKPLADPEVMEKIRRLSHDTYPRLGALIESMAALEPTRMSQSWRGLVAELCSPA